MRTMTVHEYSQVAISNDGGADSISERHAQVLEQINEAFRKQHQVDLIYWSKRNIARFSNYVGIIQLDDLIVEILPKTHKSDSDNNRGRRYLITMLRESETFPHTSADITGYSTQSTSLFDLVLYLFAHEVRKQLKKGRVHTYERKHENIRILKGKLVVHEHVRQSISKRLDFPSRYSAFTPDTPLNQLLRTAARSGWRVSLSATNKQMLSWIDAELDNAEILNAPYRVHIPTIHFDRTNQRFEKAVLLATRILNSTFPDIRGGLTDFTAMLFDMNLLFEKVVAKRIKQHVRGITTFHEQGPRKYLFKRNDKEVFALKPDIVLGVHDDNYPTTVIDTKWKLLDQADTSRFGVSQVDAYQMYAYKQRYQAKRVILVYPHHAELKTVPGCQAVFSLPTNADQTIEVWTVEAEQTTSDQSRNTFATMLFYANT